MIVNGEQKSASTASTALRLFLETKPCCDSFSKLKQRFTVKKHDPTEIAQGKKLLFEMVSSVEQMFYHICCKRRPNYEMSLIDIQFMILEALLEITGSSLLPNFEIPIAPKR